MSSKPQELTVYFSKADWFDRGIPAQLATEVRRYAKHERVGWESDREYPLLAYADFAHLADVLRAHEDDKVFFRSQAVNRDLEGRIRKRDNLRHHLAHTRVFTARATQEFQTECENILDLLNHADSR